MHNAVRAIGSLLPAECTAAVFRGFTMVWGVLTRSQWEAVRRQLRLATRIALERRDDIAIVEDARGPSRLVG